VDARAAVRKGPGGQPCRPPDRLPQQDDDRAAALLAGEAEALTRKAVELALIGDPTAMRPSRLFQPIGEYLAADFLQIQPRAITDAIFDCSVSSCREAEKELAIGGSQPRPSPSSRLRGEGRGEGSIRNGSALPPIGRELAPSPGTTPCAASDLSAQAGRDD
jgi:hypothetical protein